MVCLLVAGCEHINPQYNHFTSRLPQATQLSSVTVTNQIDPAWLQPSTELFTLGPGDKLEIEMLGEPGTRTTTTVGPDGKIYFTVADRGFNVTNGATVIHSPDSGAVMRCNPDGSDFEVVHRGLRSGPATYGITAPVSSSSFPSRCRSRDR